MSGKTKQTTAVGLNESTSDRPPYPAQQHLDATDGDRGGGVLLPPESAPDYNDVNHGTHPDLAAERNSGALGHGDADATGEPDTEADYDVSSHSVKEVEEWVGSDVSRAQTALDDEKAHKQRSSLVGYLEQVIAEAASADDAVPDGDVDEVLAWVGEDKDRAQEALDAENAKADARVTLTEPLEAMLA